MVESWETCAVGRALGASALLPALGPAAQPVMAGADSRMTMGMISFSFHLYVACNALLSI
jgi:hypothetical protein